MKNLFTIIFTLVAFISYGQIPDGYYDRTDGLQGEELKEALYQIIKDHIDYPYTSSSTDTWDILKESDRDPDNPDNVILIYTGWSVNAAQEYNNGDGWNREHIWAKSHGFPSETQDAYRDAHHLRPCDITVNSARGTKDFDNGGEPHPVATECYTDADSWEPRDAVKGDVARMMFYMATRYEGENEDPDLELVDYTGTDTDTPFFGKLSTLM
jgi:endonuclease I